MIRKCYFRGSVIFGASRNFFTHFHLVQQTNLHKLSFLIQWKGHLQVVVDLLTCNLLDEVLGVGPVNSARERILETPSNVLYIQYTIDTIHGQEGVGDGEMQ